RGVLCRTRSHGNAYPLPLRSTEHSAYKHVKTTYHSFQQQVSDSVFSAMAPLRQGASRSAMAGFPSSPQILLIAGVFQHLRVSTSPGYAQASNYRKIPLTYLHLIPNQVSYRTRKMEYTLLPDLAPHKIHAKIQVHVSRKWLFRGATDSGPLQHVDMVLSDREGNAIYAEIPGNLAEQKATNIEEGGVYDISRFRVCAAKTVFKIVDGDKMIQFTFHTIVKRATSPPTTFPLYVYRLTSFDLIEPHVQTTNNFVDVLGVITEIHELTPVHVRSQLTPTVTRTIIIEDLSNKTMKITLWADQAIMFNLHDVYDTNTNKLILVLFVGCLSKIFKGVYLSGGPACRWYFNPTIPEAEPYLTSQSTKRIVLQLPQNLQHPPAMETKPIVEHKSLYELLTVNPYDFP
ncbi:hypothetical protein ACJX0J_019643, partial [Zea mays]